MTKMTTGFFQPSLFAFLCVVYGSSVGEQPICLRKRMVASIPWSGEDTECDVEGDAVLTQGTGGVCRALCNTCIDHGIDEEGRKLVSTLHFFLMLHRLRRRETLWAESREDMPALTAGAFDGLSIAYVAGNRAIDASRCHFFILDAKTDNLNQMCNFDN